MNRIYAAAINPPQTSQLLDLLLATTGAGIQHHVHELKPLFIDGQFVDQGFRNLGIPRLQISMIWL